MSATGVETKRSALVAGIGAYLIWGFVPLAMQAVGRTGPGAWEILAHRIVWGALTAAIFVALARQFRAVWTALTSPRVMGWLFLSATLIAINWGAYIWAVNNSRVMETSLGYYLNPLLNMAAGAILFREKLDRFALTAIGLAAIGVALQTAAQGHLPVVSLALAISFCGYGVVRKRVAADAQAGLLIECLILAPLCLGYIASLALHGGGHFTASGAAMFWLIASGPVTATPLALFAWAARRLPLSAMGFLQFLAPTISFTIAVLQGEPFGALNAAAFGFIWFGAAVFVLGVLRAVRIQRQV